MIWQEMKDAPLYERILVKRKDGAEYIEILDSSKTPEYLIGWKPLDSTERELRAVAEAITNSIMLQVNNRGVTPSLIAQAAISASDSKYVKGLVELIKELSDRYFEIFILTGLGEKPEDSVMYHLIQNQMQNLPEDRRK